jgi:hypothetical protein
MLPRTRREGTYVAFGLSAEGNAGVRVGNVFIRWGVRAIPLGVSATLLGFVLLDAPARLVNLADAASPPSDRFAFVTDPEIFRPAAPLTSESTPDRVRLARIGPQAPFDFHDSCSAGCRNASVNERFAALDDHPGSFEERFATTDDRPKSFRESLRWATQIVTTSLRLPSDRAGAKRRADASSNVNVSKPHIGTGYARRKVSFPDDGRTAIYDITAQTVYMPNGRRLEAHSGYGELMDDVRHVDVTMHGPTPPNVYDLALREGLFHGVRAIRLNPVDESKMYGRAGILAHSYLLGPNGQSNGCISFTDYPGFLKAFLKGEVTRIAVVERLETPPTRLAAGQLPQEVKDLLKTDRSRQYAAAGDH